MHYLNPASVHDIGEAHLMHYLGAGRLISRAILEGQMMGFHLALPLLKITLGIPVSFSDFEYFDSEAYMSMLWVKQNDGVNTLGLDFSVMETRAGELVVVDLIPDGRNIAVTDTNKELYLQRKFEHLLFESVPAQLYAFLKGICEVIPMEVLAVFDPEELDSVLCGSDEINVADWKRSSRCSPILHRHPVKAWFWELVHEMPNEYRRRLLHFGTGSSRVPIAGFSALLSNDGQLSPFTLHAETDLKKDHIWSHTRFNRIGLPLYDSREKLETMLYATLDMELYGFTTD
ncbi:Hect ubiquitin ligase, partial [Globisporangium splendens]